MRKTFPSWNKRHVNNKAKNKQNSPLLRESISQTTKGKPRIKLHKRHYLVAETEKIHHLQ
jgi:hypothetical protein